MFNKFLLILFLATSVLAQDPTAVSDVYQQVSKEQALRNALKVMVTLKSKKINSLSPSDRQAFFNSEYQRLANLYDQLPNVKTKVEFEEIIKKHTQDFQANLANRMSLLLALEQVSSVDQDSMNFLKKYETQAQEQLISIVLLATKGSLSAKSLTLNQALTQNLKKQNRIDTFNSFNVITLPVLLTLLSWQHYHPNPFILIGSYISELLAINWITTVITRQQFRNAVTKDLATHLPSAVDEGMKIFFNELSSQQQMAPAISDVKNGNSLDFVIRFIDSWFYSSSQCQRLLTNDSEQPQIRIANSNDPELAAAEEELEEFLSLKR